MKCPQCASGDTRVVDSRPAAGGTSLRRRRHCDNCDHRFSTLEQVVMPPIYVIKKDGRREEFDADKLRRGAIKACNKRPVSLDTIDGMIQEIEAALRQEGKNEIAASRVGELVMEKLYVLDQVAYVRFASVYQRFDDVKRFAQLLERIARTSRQRQHEKVNAENHQDDVTENNQNS